MLFINLAGIALILIIIWWFWIYESKSSEVKDNLVSIVVENGVYAPANIAVNATDAITLEFLRKDASPCAGTVMIPAFEVAEELSVNKKHRIELTNLVEGDYEFHCQMNMYKGVLHVR